MLNVVGKSVGSRKPLFADFSVPLPTDVENSDQITLRDLISIVVKNEVKAFQDRQRDRQFIRVLTEREIETAASSGKIESGGAEIEPQEVNVDRAVQVALEAFQDGIYLIVVDEEQKQNLDEKIYLKSDSTVTFVRLTLLAGG